MFVTEMPDFPEALEGMRQLTCKRPRLAEATDPNRYRTGVGCSSIQEPDSTTTRLAGFCPQKRGLLSISSPIIFNPTAVPKPTKTIARVAGRKSKQPNASNSFSLSLHMTQFEPWEISVKVYPGARTLVVCGRHEITSEESTDQDGDDGYECLEYVKHLKLPVNAALEHMKCTLDQNGWLCIEAPTREMPTGEMTIPVEVINRPQHPIEDEEILSE